MFVESECKCIHPVIGMDQQDPLHILLLVTLSRCGHKVRGL